MYKVRSFFRNITLLNLLLIAAIIIFAQYAVLPKLNVNVKYAPPSVKQNSVENEVNVSEIEIPSPSDYTIIAEENLFHPERKIPAEKKGEEKPVPKPEFVLYGTVVTDNVKIAYMEDLKAPHSTPGRGKRQTALRTGDIMSGYTIKEIDVEKVVLVKGEDKMVLYVHNPKRSESKVRQAPAQTQRTPPPAARPRSSTATGSPGAIGSIQKREPVMPNPNVREKDRKVFEMLDRLKK